MEPFFNHCNPAVIKSIMLKMKKDEFISVALFIKEKSQVLPEGNQRQMYVRLLSWCKIIYREKFIK